MTILKLVDSCNHIQFVDLVWNFAASVGVSLLLGKRRSRYLSMRYIDTQCKLSYLRLEEDQKKQLRSKFVTVEQLPVRTAEEIAEITGFKPELADLIVRAFRPTRSDRAVA